MDYLSHGVYFFLSIFMIDVICFDPVYVEPDGSQSLLQLVACIMWNNDFGGGMLPVCRRLVCWLFLLL